MDTMAKKQYVRDIIVRVNANEHCTQEEITKALNYFEELTINGTLFGTRAETMHIGGLLSAALGNVSK